MAQSRFNYEFMNPQTPSPYPSVVTLNVRSLSIGAQYMGVSENRGPYYRTLNSRILVIRTPK